MSEDHSRAFISEWTEILLVVDRASYINHQIELLFRYWILEIIPTNLRRGRDYHSQLSRADCQQASGTAELTDQAGDRRRPHPKDIPA